MARRKGVNSRKKYVQRKKKVASKVRRILPLAGWCGIALVVAGAAVYGVKIGYGRLSAAIDRSSLMVIKKISVTGNDRVAAASIIEQCGIGNVGKMYRLKSDSIIAALSGNPWIRRVRCVKKWWGEVIIEVRERKPVALVHNGTVHLVDEQGVVLPVEPGKTYDLPLLCAIPVAVRSNGWRQCDSARFERALQFVATVKQEDEGLLREITQMDMSDADAIRCCIGTGKAVVTIGCDAGRRQLKNLRCLLEVLENSDETPVVVDMRYQNLAFVKSTAKQRTAHASVN
jgi:hypothetical protein